MMRRSRLTKTALTLTLICSNWHRGDTYRAVYTVKFSGWVYVLHCFQKKSKSGITTPKEAMDLIHARLKAAKLDFEAWQMKPGVRR